MKNCKNRKTKCAFWGIIFSMLLAFLVQVPEIYAKGSSGDYVEYNGKLYDTSVLSEDTIEWLEWYNSLSLDLQEMVSNEPAELTSVGSDEMVSRLVINNTYLNGIGSISIQKIPDDFPPLFRYAPAYNPSYWNAAENIKHANCYAYCLNYRTKNEGKLQPGDLAGKRFTSLTKNAIIKAAKADAPYLEYKITATTKTAVPRKNQYKIALVIAPNADYHWYIQNRDGYWSHKRGFEKISNLDASGKKIQDPQNCDRKYGNRLDYSVFCGYFMVQY